MLLSFPIFTITSKYELSGPLSENSGTAKKELIQFCLENELRPHSYASARVSTDAVIKEIGVAR